MCSSDQAWRVAALCVAFSAACGGRDAAVETPIVEAVTPACGDNATATAVTVRGSLPVKPVIWISDPTSSQLDSAYRAWVGDVELTGVAWRDASELKAVVPAGIPVGTYALTLRSPFGTTATKDAAFQVRAGACLVETAALVVTSPVAAPATLTVGQDLTVMATVQNSGQASALGVLASIVSAPAGLTFKSGPAGPQDVPGGQARTFNWIYAATSAGGGVFVIDASGRAADTGQSVVAPEVNTNAVLASLGELPHRQRGGGAGGGDGRTAHHRRPHRHQPHHRGGGGHAGHRGRRAGDGRQRAVAPEHPRRHHRGLPVDLHRERRWSGLLRRQRPRDRSRHRSGGHGAHRDGERHHPGRAGAQRHPGHPGQHRAGRLHGHHAGHQWRCHRRHVVDVVPDLPAAKAGSSAVVLFKSGPTGAPATVIAGQPAVAFTWVFTATAPGTLTLTSAARGKDANTGAPVVSAAADSNPARVGLYTVGGTVSGLTGTGLVLRNGAETPADRRQRDLHLRHAGRERQRPTR